MKIFSFESFFSTSYSYEISKSFFQVSFQKWKQLKGHMKPTYLNLWINFSRLGFFFLVKTIFFGGFSRIFQQRRVQWSQDQMHPPHKIHEKIKLRLLSGSKSCWNMSTWSLKTKKYNVKNNDTQSLKNIIPLESLFPFYHIA